MGGAGANNISDINLSRLRLSEETRRFLFKLELRTFTKTALPKKGTGSHFEIQK